MATRTPPKFVPTLTEVVQTGAAPLGAPAADTLPALTQEQLAQRVLQRVELTLDRRLREAVAATIVEHTSALTPLLRERVESVVREVVAEALADELQARQRPDGTNV
ncbi:MAG TPA: hypothetical protein VFM98_00910 [Ramlibacter sp.]|uniref:hypothetical protein n=1 Tax=Ramlibacter sp. TaxID=1917967 RepID=UPI002D807443|nr:hypothetical protein [Ramlibacter sp.]HET8744135.1 hypothetical protein [Ramlibacter sp.]